MIDVCRVGAPGIRTVRLPSGRGQLQRHREPPLHPSGRGPRNLNYLGRRADEPHRRG